MMSERYGVILRLAMITVAAGVVTYAVGITIVRFLLLSLTETKGE